MKFIEYLKQIKNNQAFSNSLIVKTQYCCDFNILYKSYLKALVCSNESPFCNKCDLCNRINKDAYVDLIYIANDEKNISKDDIINIQENFMKFASEDAGVKLYVIKNMEKTNKQVMNSLLKFIEESPQNTYALFFTNNVNQINPTIVSRSHVITVDDISESLSKNNALNNIIKDAFNDYDEYKKFSQEFDIMKINDIANQGLNMKTSLEEITFVRNVIDLKKWELSVLLNILIKKCNLSAKSYIMEMIRNLKLNINVRNSAVVLAQWLKAGN